MSEHKGKSGKKPKYLIADIGGTDQTAQDVSTERVLNFLIRGEIGNANQPSPDSGHDIEHSAFINPPENEGSNPGHPFESQSPFPSLQSSQQKKSLAHLFARAKGGVDQNPQKSSEPQPTSPPEIIAFQEGSLPIQGHLNSAINSAQENNQIYTSGIQNSAEHNLGDKEAPLDLELINFSQINHTQPTSNDTKAIPTVSPNSSKTIEFDKLNNKWKTFYRLKDGEIIVLTSLFQMTHVEGSDSCYVKMQKLAEKSKLTYRYCQKVVRSLEQLGWITKIKDYDPTNQLGVLYRVNLSPVHSFPSES